MLPSIRPTRIRWQVAPAMVLRSALKKVLTQSFVLADQQRGWHYGYLRKSVI